MNIDQFLTAVVIAVLLGLGVAHIRELGVVVAAQGKSITEAIDRNTEAIKKSTPSVPPTRGESP